MEAQLKLGQNWASHKNWFKKISTHCTQNINKLDFICNLALTDESIIELPKTEIILFAPVFGWKTSLEI